MERFLLILPVYNEISNLKKNLEKIYKEVKRLNGKLVVAEDGSTDGSKEFIKSFATNHEIEYFLNEKRLGRGKAIKNVCSLKKAKIYSYIDSDLAVGLKNIERAVLLIENGYDIVVGSRYKSKKAKRSFKRLFLSKFYNFLVRILLKSKISDHQCGFKFWNEKANKICKEVKDNHWFFDTEFLVRAQRKNLKVYEMGVDYKEQKKTKVRILEIFYFLNKILELRRQLKV